MAVQAEFRSQSALSPLSFDRFSTFTFSPFFKRRQDQRAVEIQTIEESEVPFDASESCLSCLPLPSLLLPRFS